MLKHEVHIVTIVLERVNLFHFLIIYSPKTDFNIILQSTSRRLSSLYPRPLST
jgi:hypothetical protein